MAAGRKTALIGTTLVLVLVIAGTIAGLNRRFTVPDVTFTGVRGGQITLSSLKGKVVLVNFWATTCAVCMREMPKIVENHEKFQARGFETVAVAMPYDPPNRVFAHAEQARLPFPVVLDIFGKAVRAFGGVAGTPTAFLVDRRGRVIRRFEGEPDFGDLARLIEKELAEG